MSSTGTTAQSISSPWTRTTCHTATCAPAASTCAFSLRRLAPCALPRASPPLHSPAPFSTPPAPPPPRAPQGLKRTPARFDCGAANGSTTFGRGERPGDMLSWLRRDLSVVSADPRVRFLVAYFHHSPFMRGDHNSDNAGREPQSAFARAQLLPLLEEAGVDLVLSGATDTP